MFRAFLSPKIAVKLFQNLNNNIIRRESSVIINQINNASSCPITAQNIRSIENINNKKIFVRRLSTEAKKT
jgi:hypothetical protein